ncbi:MAG: helix-turn-helix transcriptional regulator [Lachnospiraceae bacterium]|nr:helix-turn-helix transcriptional regulator [Lachnospiraceae bacterium]
MIVWNPLKIGVRIRFYRHLIRLSQEEAAEKAGVGFRTYADAERGVSANLRVPTLVSICTALNVTPNDILLSPGALPEIQETFDRIYAMNETQYYLTARYVQDIVEVVR